jgi:translocation protein SEC63
MNYNYDESGILHVYFALPLLLLVLLPVTLKWIRSLQVEGEKANSQICKCEPCNLKRAWLNERTPRFHGRFILLLLGWALFFALVRHVFIHGKVQKAAFDPFEILGVSSSASDLQIKKAYRLASLKFHPDKVRGVAPEVAQEKFVLISRAYKALSDPVAKQNYETYGNPDGPSTQDIGIALPSWLVSKNSFWVVLGLYAGVFMLALPWWIRKWWSASSRLTKDKIMHLTMALFYRDVRENFGVKKILELLSAAVEFKEEMPRRPSDAASISALHNALKDAIGAEFEASKKYTANYCVKAHCLLYAYLYRYPLPDAQMKEDEAFVVEKAHLLLNGLIQICLAKGWFHTLKNCILLGQMLIQAVPEHANQLLQLPFISMEEAASFKNRKTPVKGLKEFLTLALADQRVLFNHMSDQEYSQAINVARSFPFVEIERIKTFVQGYEDIAVGSIMTISVTLKRVYLGQSKKVLESDESEGVDGEEFEMDEDCCVKKKLLFSTASSAIDPIHAPYFKDSQKKPNWWVILTDDDGDFVAPPQRITHLDEGKGTSVVFQVQAPSGPTSLRYTATLKADYALGLDCSKDFKIQVVAITGEDSNMADYEDLSDEDEDDLNL